MGSGFDPFGDSGLALLACRVEGLDSHNWRKRRGLGLRVLVEGLGFRVWGLGPGV